MENLFNSLKRTNKNKEIELNAIKFFSSKLNEELVELCGIYQVADIFI